MSRCPPSELLAAQTGGCGPWIGLGGTRRFGICRYLPSKLDSSLVMAPSVIVRANRGEPNTLPMRSRLSVTIAASLAQSASPDRFVAQGRNVRNDPSKRYGRRDV